MRHLFKSLDEKLIALLESLTKEAKRTILIDDATRIALAQDASIEALGPAQLKGKSTAVDVFCVPCGQKL